MAWVAGEGSSGDTLGETWVGGMCSGSQRARNGQDGCMQDGKFTALCLIIVSAVVRRKDACHGGCLGGCGTSRYIR